MLPLCRSPKPTLSFRQTEQQREASQQPLWQLSANAFWLFALLLLQNARDADPNSMIRLAKMYLNGQGCQRNIALAQEWVRKARCVAASIVVVCVYIPLLSAY